MSKQEFQLSQTYVPSSDNYLIKNYILEYLNDSIHQLLEVKNCNPKVDVLEFFTEYFKSVKQGTHVLFREFSYISSTPHNRACFIEKFLETFYTMIEKEDMLKVCDYHSLVLLLCQDFPVEIIENSLKIISPDNLMASFKDFIYALQFQLYYKEFLNEAKLIYENLYFKNNLISLDGEPIKFNTDKYADSLENLKHKFNFSVPPKIAITNSLQTKKDEFSFNEFIKTLCFNDLVTQLIDKLPIRSQLCEYKKPNIKAEINESEGKTTEQDAKKEQSTVASSDYSRFQKPAPKLIKKSINTSKDSDNSRSTSTDSSSDSDT